MNAKSLRRLASDHASLHTLGLPPNYIFPAQSNSLSSCCDDLSALDVLLAGPEGTAYQNGIFSLHLSIPKEYPNSPPTATFKTKIWHPNVDEKGAVCVDTLKSGWEKTLSLRDVLVTISCLLIQPNPASALNAEAGMLIQNGEWAAFEKRAKVLCSVYAAIPDSMKSAVEEARRRGEEKHEEDADAKKSKGKGKAGKGRVVVQTQEVAQEEENVGSKQKKQPEDVESDPEADWIPKPKQRPLDLGTDNIFGIRTDSTAKAPQAEDVMDLDSSLGTVVHNEDVSSIDFAQPYTPTKSQPSSSNHRFGADVLDPLPVTPASRSALNSLEHPKEPQASPELPLFEFSWPPTRQSPKGKGRAAKRSPETLRREKSEVRKMKAAGYSITKYNRGHFGPRKGLMRL